MKVLRPPCLPFMHRWQIVHVWAEGGAIRVCGRCGAKEQLREETHHAK